MHFFKQLEIIGSNVVPNLVLIYGFNLNLGMQFRLNNPCKLIYNELKSLTACFKLNQLVDNFFKTIHI